MMRSAGPGLAPKTTRRTMGRQLKEEMNNINGIDRRLNPAPGVALLEAPRDDTAGRKVVTIRG